MRTSRNDNDVNRRRRPSTPPLPLSRTQSFTCSADLLRAFEHRAFQLGCSFDWLLEEAMQRLLAEGSDLENDDDVATNDTAPPAPATVHQMKPVTPVSRMMPKAEATSHVTTKTVPPPLPPQARPQAKPLTVPRPPQTAPLPLGFSSASVSLPLPPDAMPSTVPPPPARAMLAIPTTPAAFAPAPPPPPAPPAASGVAPVTPRLPSLPSLPPPPPPPETLRDAVDAASNPLVLYYGEEQLVIDRHPYVIGRSAVLADLVIEDGEVSRRHAVIEHTPDGWMITDLGSTNGMIVNGVVVRHAYLRAGVVMSIGPMAFGVAAPM